MTMRDVPTISVTPTNRDFVELAESMHCDAARPQSHEELQAAIQKSFTVPRPTLVELCENADWLKRPVCKC